MASMSNGGGAGPNRNSNSNDINQKLRKDAFLSATPRSWIENPLRTWNMLRTLQRRVMDAICCTQTTPFPGSAVLLMNVLEPSLASLRSVEGNLVFAMLSSNNSQPHLDLGTPRISNESNPNVSNSARSQTLDEEDLSRYGAHAVLDRNDGDLNESDSLSSMMAPQSFVQCFIRQIETEVRGIEQRLFEKLGHELCQQPVDWLRARSLSPSVLSFLLSALVENGNPSSVDSVESCILFLQKRSLALKEACRNSGEIPGSYELGHYNNELQLVENAQRLVDNLFMREHRARDFRRRGDIENGDSISENIRRPGNPILRPTVTPRSSEFDDRKTWADFQRNSQELPHGNSRRLDRPVDCPVGPGAPAGVTSERLYLYKIAQSAVGRNSHNSVLPEVLTNPRSSGSSTGNQNSAQRNILDPVIPLDNLEAIHHHLNEGKEESRRAPINSPCNNVGLNGYPEVPWDPRNQLYFDAVFRAETRRMQEQAHAYIAQEQQNHAFAAYSNRNNGSNMFFVPVGNTSNNLQPQSGRQQSQYDSQGCLQLNSMPSVPMQLNFRGDQTVRNPMMDSHLYVQHVGNSVGSDGCWLPGPPQMAFAQPPVATPVRTGGDTQPTSEICNAIYALTQKVQQLVDIATTNERIVLEQQNYLSWIEGGFQYLRQDVRDIKTEVTSTRFLANLQLARSMNDGGSNDQQDQGGQFHRPNIPNSNLMDEFHRNVHQQQPPQSSRTGRNSVSRSGGMGMNVSSRPQLSNGVERNESNLDIPTACLLSEMGENIGHQLRHIYDQRSGTTGRALAGSNSMLNNQVPPGSRTNNYWDNFKSYSRQNMLSSSKVNIPNNRMSPTDSDNRSVHEETSNNNPPPGPSRQDSRRERNPVSIPGGKKSSLSANFVENIGLKQRNREVKLQITSPCRSTSSNNVPSHGEIQNVASNFAATNNIASSSNGDVETKGWTMPWNEEHDIIELDSDSDVRRQQVRNRTDEGVNQQLRPETAVILDEICLSSSEQNISGSDADTNNLFKPPRGLVTFSECYEDVAQVPAMLSEGLNLPNGGHSPSPSSSTDRTQIGLNKEALTNRFGEQNVESDEEQENHQPSRNRFRENLEDNNLSLLSSSRGEPGEGINTSPISPDLVRGVFAQDEGDVNDTGTEVTCNHWRLEANVIEGNQGIENIEDVGDNDINNVTPNEEACIEG